MLYVTNNITDLQKFKNDMMRNEDSPNTDYYNSMNTHRLIGINKLSNASQCTGPVGRVDSPRARVERAARRRRPARAAHRAGHQARRRHAHAQPRSSAAGHSALPHAAGAQRACEYSAHKSIMRIQI